MVNQIGKENEVGGFDGALSELTYEGKAAVASMLTIALSYIWRGEIEYAIASLTMALHRIDFPLQELEQHLEATSDLMDQLDAARAVKD